MCRGSWKFQLVPFENTPENAREILNNLGQNIDVIAGIFDDAMLRLRGCNGIEILKEPSEKVERLIHAIEMIKQN